MSASVLNDTVTLLHSPSIQESFNVLSVAVAIAVVGVTFGYYQSTRGYKTSSGIYQLPGISLFTAWTFFEKRYDFLWSNFKTHKFFQFHVLQHKVVALSGEDGRKVFFSNPSLDFTEGYRILMGGAPLLDNVDVDKSESRQGEVSFFNKYLLRILHKDRVADVFPTLFADINQNMVAWGRSGRMDPFVDVYDLVFLMTARMATCRALAEDRTALAKVSELFTKLQTSATPTSLLLPWLPSRAKKDNTQATADLYMMLLGYVSERRKEAPTSEAIDVLIAEGLEDNAIVGWVLGVLFAGVLNTGVNACWVLLHLAVNPEWKEKCREEAQKLTDTHLAPGSTIPLHERLASIPPPAWEEEMPVFDAVIRETLRVAFNGAALRRNLHEDIKIGDQTIERGAFMTYSLADVHLNEELYPDPERFDPGRFLNKEDTSKVVYPYLGWGVGRHPCTGMRVAKLEMKMIIAMFVLGYNFDLVDKNGKPTKSMPRPDRNDHHQTRPLQPCYLSYERTVD